MSWNVYGHSPNFIMVSLSRVIFAQNPSLNKAAELLSHSDWGNSVPSGIHMTNSRGGGGPSGFMACRRDTSSSHELINSRDSSHNSSHAAVKSSLSPTQLST
jgi:hypothetical protein